MPPVALGLLLVAATLHMGWNLLVKRAGQKQIFTWCALIVGSVCFSPLLITSSPLPVRIWPYVVSSALVEAIYYIALIRGYEIGDFSLIYPVARGAAPAFLVIWATLFLGEHPRPMGLAGLALLVLGLILVGGGVLWSQRKTAVLNRSAIAVALGTACCISIYTVIDGAAVRFAASLPYTVLVIGLSAVLFTPAVFIHYGPRAVALEWRAHWFPILIAGLLALLAYILVLYVYTIARVSYAGAVREISIVLAAFVGWRWLGEGFGLTRMAGASLIFVGILVITIAG